VQASKAHNPVDRLELNIAPAPYNGNQGRLGLPYAASVTPALGVPLIGNTNHPSWMSNIAQTHQRQSATIWSPHTQGERDGETSDYLRIASRKLRWRLRCPDHNRSERHSLCSRSIPGRMRRRGWCCSSWSTSRCRGPTGRNSSRGLAQINVRAPDMFRMRARGGLIYANLRHAAIIENFCFEIDRL